MGVEPFFLGREGAEVKIIAYGEADVTVSGADVSFGYGASSNNIAS